MANAIDPYIINIYAQEAFANLENALGMANTIHRGYSKEPGEVGKDIKIKVPSTFTAQTTPSAAAQDISTSEITLSLDTYRKVEFKVADTDLSYTSDVLIENHIRPAVYTLANEIDTILAGFADDIPWFVDATETPTNLNDLAECRRILFDNKVPVNDGMTYVMINGEREAAFLNYLAPANVDARNGNVQVNGSLGQLFGMNIFANQNVQSHTAGALVGSPIVNDGGDALAVGDTSISLDAGSLTGTVKAGDTFVIAGDTQRYVVTADATAATNAITVSFAPGLTVDPGDGAAVTFRQASDYLNLAYHKSFMALGFSALPDHSGLGGVMQTVADPITGLGLRLGSYWSGSAKEFYMFVDVLFGTKMLDRNRAVRYETATTW